MTTENVLKQCSTCKENLAVEHFHKNKSKADGRHHCCKQCQRNYYRKHYASNKEQYLARNKRTRKRRQARMLQQKANTPCSDCGGTFHPFIMEYDHRDPSTKNFSIGSIHKNAGRKLAEELEKCDLVCANCHKMRTFRRHSQNPNFTMGILDAFV